MKLSPETKHSLIIGGGLIVAVVLGIIVYKKYETNSQASNAASDQASQDELAYIESMALGGGAYPEIGAEGGSAITIPSAPATTSLADEISQLEQAFGFGTPAAGSSTSATSAPSGSSSSGSASSSPQPQPPLRHTSGEPSTNYILAQPPIDTLEERVAPEGSYVA